MTSALARRSPARPQAILFDWDNTLVDSWGTIHEALNVTLTAMGKSPWTLEETKDRVRQSLRDSFPRLFGADWDKARQIYLETFKSIHLDRLRPLTGAAEMIRDLAASGIYLGIVSNKTGSILRREAERLGWSDYFGRLVGANDASADKPEVAPVEMALAGSGILRGPDVWFVGDTAIDMECALNAGCTPVLLGGSGPDDAEFERYKPELHFGDSYALYRHVATL